MYIVFREININYFLFRYALINVRYAKLNYIVHYRFIGAYKLNHYKQNKNIL